MVSFLCWSDLHNNSANGLILSAANDQIHVFICIFIIETSVLKHGSLTFILQYAKEFFYRFTCLDYLKGLYWKKSIIIALLIYYSMSIFQLDRKTGLFSVWFIVANSCQGSRNLSRLLCSSCATLEIIFPLKKKLVTFSNLPSI